MIEETYSIHELFAMFKRNMRAFTGIIITCAVISVVLAFALPKKFKSRSVLNIQAGYFQNPLISDLISTANDEAELRAQRSSLLRLALSDQFLDELGEKHGIFRHPIGTPNRLIERELFFESIEYYAVSASTFQISVIAGDADKARDLTKAVLERMISTLVDERHKTLAKTRDAIHAHVQMLGVALRNNGAGAAPLQDRDSLVAELQKLGHELDVLLVKFTDRHPQVVELIKRRESLEQNLKAMPQDSDSEGVRPDAGMFGSVSKEPAQELYNELLKKLSYLTIVLEMERDHTQVSYLGIIEQPTTPVRALFPNKRMFLAVGVAVGLLLSVVWMAVAELSRGAQLSAEEVSEVLEVPFLGALPRLATEDKIVLLEAPPQALPALPLQ